MARNKWVGTIIVIEAATAAAAGRLKCVGRGRDVGGDLGITKRSAKVKGPEAKCRVSKSKAVTIARPRQTVDRKKMER